MDRKVARKIAALTALVNSGKLKGSFLNKEFRKITNINDLLCIIHSGLGDPMLRFILPAVCNHKNCTIKHLHGLFTNPKFFDYQKSVADLFLTRNDLSASWVSIFIESARLNDVGFHIISQLGRNQAHQILLIDTFSSRQLPLHYQQKLANEIVRYPLAYKYHFIFSKTDDIYVRLTFAIAMAKTATDATSEDFFQLFNLINGNADWEAAFVNSLRVPDFRLLFRIFTKTGFEKTNAVCIEKLRLIDPTPDELDYIVRYCAEHRGVISDKIESIVRETYTRIPVEHLLDMLWGLREHTAPNSYKRNMIYEALRSRIDELSEIAGIAQK